MTDFEQALIKRAQRGDKAAFRQLYDTYSGRVYGICRRLCRDQGRAEEATQEVFIKIWQQLPAFAFKSAFSTWLHSIATRTAIDAWRREQTRAVPASTGEEAVSLDEPLDGALERAIQELPGQARAVFVLVAVEGYTHAEVAEFLAIAKGSSKAQYFRARQLLKKRLYGEE